MIDKAFTNFSKVAATASLVPVLLAMLSAPAGAQEQRGGAAAQAVARATVIHAATLRVDAQSFKLVSRAQLSGQFGAAPDPKRFIRPCSTDAPARCTLIVFDLP
jgi:hypothetical protein